ncbi:MAG TPA: sigma-70 family RNA polymerase sigma factor [Ktedonobacterales bacterium]|jgi:RNA polymerase sigma-70 factor (ECF subfamily)
MESFIRFFNLSDADGPGEGSKAQIVSSPGGRSPETGRALAARAANGDAAGDAEMAQPELLETVAETTELSGTGESDECRAGRPRTGIGVAETGSVSMGGAEDDAEDEDEEEETTEEDEAPGAPGDDLIDLSDFEMLFQRYQTPIINFVFRLVGNREQAYDLSQDVFVKAYKALAGGTKIHAGALSSWLYRIAANTATDSLRRKRLIAWLPLSLFNEDRGVGAGVGTLSGEPGGGGAEEGFSSAASLYDGAGYNGGRFEQRVADREIVDNVLGKLPVKYATCLLLYEHEGFSCNEIADVLKISPSAVKMRLMRARERFIALYQQEVDGL